jgi:hypothetical protein
MTCRLGASLKLFMLMVVNAMASVSILRSLFIMMAVLPVPVLPTNMT